MTLSRGQIGALVMRMQNDFLARPALTLPLPQAARRFGVDINTCKVILDVLLDARVLTKTTDGAYARFFPRREARVAHGSARAA